MEWRSHLAAFCSYLAIRSDIACLNFHSGSRGQAFKAYLARLPGSGPGFLLVILLPVITLVVIVVVRLEIHVVEHHAENFRSNVIQQLLGTAHDVARALAAMDHEQHAVD